jgi:hypothetical protein
MTTPVPLSAILYGNVFIFNKMINTFNEF